MYTSKGPKVAAGEERAPDMPPSGICQSLTLQSSDPVASRESWKGEKSKSVTKPGVYACVCVTVYDGKR